MVGVGTAVHWANTSRFTIMKHHHEFHVVLLICFTLMYKFALAGIFSFAGLLELSGDPRRKGTFARDGIFLKRGNGQRAQRRSSTGQPIEVYELGQGPLMGDNECDDRGSGVLSMRMRTRLRQQSDHKEESGGDLRNTISGLAEEVWSSNDENQIQDASQPRGTSRFEDDLVGQKS
jgi:hypothetical protein